VVFLDTPGIHRPLHRMNVRMVDAAVQTIKEVDVLGLVLDAAEPPGKTSVTCTPVARSILFDAMPQRGLCGLPPFTLVC
jgi:GTPase Era involved in 16S rRNA processing